jgi:tetratricopeptide (TPR) repeat protein
MRFLVVAAAVLAMALTPSLADAKAKAKVKGPKPGQLTQEDLRTCMGLNNSKPEEQIPACTKIIKSGDVKHPYEADYYATRGAAYFSLSQYDKSLADLDKAISVRQAAEFYFQRGLLHIARAEPALAKADLDQVIKLKPDFSPAYMMRGVVSYKSGAYGEAVTFFDGAVKRVPTYYQALFARGVAKKKSGDDRGGEKDIADARGMSSTVDADLKKLGISP